MAAVPGCSATLGKTFPATVPYSIPISAPSIREAKNRPPRKPDPSETDDASALRRMVVVSRSQVGWAISSSCIAPWPAPSTVGVRSAMPPSSAPPTTGRNAPRNQRSGWNARSNVAIINISVMLARAQITPISTVWPIISAETGVGYPAICRNACWFRWRATSHAATALPTTGTRLAAV